MRIPSERPSKSWWKTIAATREAVYMQGAAVSMRAQREGEGRGERDALNSGPVVMDSVRPITSEWIMIPICSTCCWFAHAAQPSRHFLR